MHGGSASEAMAEAERRLSETIARAERLLAGLALAAERELEAGRARVLHEADGLANGFAALANQVRENLDLEQARRETSASAQAQLTERVARAERLIAGLVLAAERELEEGRASLERTGAELIDGAARAADEAVERASEAGAQEVARVVTARKEAVAHTMRASAESRHRIAVDAAAALAAARPVADQVPVPRSVLHTPAAAAEATLRPGQWIAAAAVRIDAARRRLVDALERLRSELRSEADRGISELVEPAAIEALRRAHGEIESLLLERADEASAELERAVERAREAIAAEGERLHDSIGTASGGKKLDRKVAKADARIGDLERTIEATARATEANLVADGRKALAALAHAAEVSAKLERKLGEQALAVQRRRFEASREEIRANLKGVG